MGAQLLIGGKIDIGTVRQGLKVILGQNAGDKGLSSQIQTLIDRCDNALAGVEVGAVPLGVSPGARVPESVPANVPASVPANVAADASGEAANAAASTHEVSRELTENGVANASGSVEVAAGRHTEPGQPSNDTTGDFSQEEKSSDGAGEEMKESDVAESSSSSPSGEPQSSPSSVPSETSEGDEEKQQAE